MVRESAVAVLAVSVFLSTTAYSADLSLACRGIVRKDGTATEMNIFYELEFFFTTGAYRMYSYPGGVRKKRGEGNFSADNNEIVWGGGTTIDRQSGNMVRSYTSKGANWTEYMKCVRDIDGGTQF